MSEDRDLGIDLFGRVWELLDKGDRSSDENAEMLAAAFASRWHWGQAAEATKENLAIGDWQVAHVASQLGHGSVALEYATRALAAADAEGWGDWQRASMLEGMARACAAVGDTAGRAKYFAEASAALETIVEAEDRELIASQLATVPEA
jgi:hypothetical protein